MIDVVETFKEVTSKVNFDINAGMSVDMAKPMCEFVPDIVKHIDNGGVGCCLHSSVYLCKLLNDRGIYSEIVLTPEPTLLPNGETRTDLRASVLYLNDGKLYVANPVEDAEVFTEKGIDREKRKSYYEKDSCKLTIPKEGIVSDDASCIPLDEYVNKYGDGTGYQLGSLFGEDKEVLSLRDLMKTALTIDLDDLKEIYDRFGSGWSNGM